MIGLVKRSTTDKKRLVRETLRIYAREAWRHPYLLTGSFISSFLYGVSDDIVIPLLMAQLVDVIVQTEPNFSQAYNFAWGVAGASLFSFFIARVTFRFRNPMMSHTLQALSGRIFAAYERQEYGFYANSFVGSLVARATRFLNTFKDLYDNVLFPGTFLFVQIVVPVIILALRAWVLGLIFFVAAFAMLAITVSMSKYKTPHLRRAAASDSRVTAALADVLANNTAVKLFARAAYETKRFEDITGERRRLFDIQMRVGEKIRATRSMTILAFQIAVVFALVNLTEMNTISVGTILLTQIYFTKLAMSLWNLNRVVERLEESLADSAEMTEVMLRQPTVKDPQDHGGFSSNKGTISFQDVQFHYEDGQQTEALFDRLSFEIPAGQKVGLVGPSGGGKSTLTRLLLRFMDVQNGRIVIDGQNIKKVTQDELRAHIAYVPQEPVLFHRSIRENIHYGNPDASEQAVIHAAQLAHAHEFIKQLPHSYDTLVGERGVKLSGGEKQRVAIARAILKKAPILILDEATSALDSKSEKAIVAALDNLMKNRTTIVIAHRLSTIRKLDRIIVLHDGRIVEDGSHEELLKRSKGVYADLWQHQSDVFLAD